MSPAVKVKKAKGPVIKPSLPEVRQSPLCAPLYCEVHRETPWAYSPTCGHHTYEAWNHPNYHQPPGRRDSVVPPIGELVT